MPSQGLRARIVDEAPGRGPTCSASPSVTARAVCGARAALCLALSLLVLIASVSTHSGGRASTELPVGADFAAWAGDGDAFFASTSETGQYRQNSNTLAVCELDALAFEEVEEDGGLDAHTLGALATRAVPTLLCPRQTLGAAPVAYPARFLISSARPRGPPSTSC